MFIVTSFVLSFKYEDHHSLPKAFQEGHWFFTWDPNLDTTMLIFLQITKTTSVFFFGPSRAYLGISLSRFYPSVARVFVLPKMLRPLVKR